MTMVYNTAGGATSLNNCINRLRRDYFKRGILAAVDDYGILHDIDTSGDLKFAHLCHDAGRVMKEFNDYDKALELYAKSLAVKEKVLGTDDTDTAATYSNIAEVTRAKGDVDGALEMHQKALAVNEKVLGEEHADTAISYAGIAEVLKEKGDLDGALQMHHKSLAIKEKVFGDEHTETA